MMSAFRRSTAFPKPPFGAKRVATAYSSANNIGSQLRSQGWYRPSSFVQRSQNHEQDHKSQHQGRDSRPTPAANHAQPEDRKIQREQRYWPHGAQIVFQGKFFRAKPTINGSARCDFL